MSYRLIDSNALAQTHPEVNDMPCIYADLDCLDGRLYDLREPSALQAENDKLRKLVNDMWICVSHGSGWDCTGCRRDPDSVCILGISEFSQRMRNLGIEASV